MLLQLFLGIVTLLSWLSIFHVLQSDRKPEVTIGWVLALFFITPLALPTYWVFGFRRYRGYTQTLRRTIAINQDYVQGFFDNLSRHREEDCPPFDALQSLTPFPLTRDNHIELLIDGPATYQAIFHAISQAKHYVLVQYFIIETGDTGDAFFELLLQKAREGVKVYLLHDYFGSRRMHHRYVQKCEAAGIRMRPFRSPRIHRSLYHINFRNHRKIVVVDGQYGFTGGLNIGDKYMGRSAGLRHWRDTHLKLTGPVALELQATFMSDWLWTTGELIQELSWSRQDPTPLGTQTAAIFPTGPADARPVCILKLVALIQEARERLWIATPYLIPYEAIMVALEAAVRRGVEVRILTTGAVDHYIVFAAGWYYAEQLRRAGVRIFRYNEGFMHQKVLLVDQKLASVGTVNLDPRSYSLNFEVSLISPDSQTIRRVESMLSEDFESATENLWEWKEIGATRRTTARFLRLFSPLI